MRIPAEPGSYIILGKLVDDAYFNSGSFSGKLLSRGYYLYSGSAFGPGGLHARVARHLKPDTRRFWHYDHLKALLQIEEIWYSLDGKNQECQFIKVLQVMKNSSFPFPKFGSSDCHQNCPAHLVKFPLDANIDSAYNLLKKHISSIQRISSI